MTNVEETPGESTRSWWRKPLWTCLALVAGGAVWLGWLLRDIPPPDVSDLAIERRDLPPERNAYGPFERAAAVSVWVNWSADQTRIKDYLGGKPVDTAPILDLIAKNEEALRLIREGLAREACIRPRESLISGASPLLRWRNLGKLMAADTMRLRLAGKRAEAVDAALAQVRFGDLVTGGAGDLVQWLTGCWLVVDGLDSCEALARDPAATEQELARIARGLGALEPPGLRLIPALKAEYWEVDRLIGRIEQGSCPLRELRGGGPEWVDLESLLGGCLFAPNRSRAWVADSYRREIAGCGMTYAACTGQRGEREGDTLDSFERLRRSVGFDRAMLQNFYGLEVGFAGYKCYAECLLSGTRLVVAVRRFELRTGHLPARLEDLVPDELAAVPQDPYAGGPFRYSQENGIVYAVGRDLADSGGSEKTPFGKKPRSRHHSDAMDQVFRFREEAPP